MAGWKSGLGDGTSSRDNKWATVKRGYICTPCAFWAKTRYPIQYSNEPFNIRMKIPIGYHTTPVRPPSSHHMYVTTNISTHIILLASTRTVTCSRSPVCTPTEVPGMANVVPLYPYRKAYFSSYTDPNPFIVRIHVCIGNTHDGIIAWRDQRYIHTRAWWVRTNINVRFWLNSYVRVWCVKPMARYLQVGRPSRSCCWPFVSLLGLSIQQCNSRRERDGRCEGAGGESEDNRNGGGLSLSLEDRLAEARQ